MIAAVIDVGTNSIKLIVGRRGDVGSIESIAHASVNSRLGEGVDKTHEISAEAADRSIAAISKLLNTARKHNANCVRIVGTSAMRDARNRDQIVERVRNKLDANLEILSEQDECRYSYLAVALDPVLGKYEGKQVVVDVGGGSSELTYGVGKQRLSGKSVRIGAVRLTERFLMADPPSRDDLDKAEREAEALISAGAPDGAADRAVGVGGSAVNLARMLKKIPIKTFEGIHGTTIFREQMRHLVEELASNTLTERKGIIGIEPARADIILGGAVILQAIMAVTGADELIVSVFGLRFGILYDMLEAF